MNNSFSPFTFDGRLGRGRYLGYSVLLIVIATVVMYAGVFAVAFLGDSYLSERNAEAFGIVYFLVIGLLGISYDVRRLHDLGHSGKWAIALLVPWGLVIPWDWLIWVLGGIILLYLIFAPGTDGRNDYGEGR